ncbi:MAG: nickel pincer cofactor biosynthesis protein LarC [Candidatus Sumerlaeia bacterium]
MKTLYLSCFAGISGNMTLGALIDLGLPENKLKEELAKLKVGGYHIDVRRVIKQGISSVYVDVVLGDGDTDGYGHGHGHAHRHGHDHDHGHSHDHEHHPDHGHTHDHGHSQEHKHGDFRNLSVIRKLIDESDLDPVVKDRSKAVFLRLAKAEAKVHGTTIDKVHFHEVGALDTIVDIVGSVFGLHYLGVEKVIASRVRTGAGFVQCAHGQMPVPAPATAELLQGIPNYQGDIEKEMTTPTGAVLLAELCDGFGDMPEGFISKKTGYGAGGWDLEIPNVLRAQLGELAAERGPVDRIEIIECNIDDANPQIYEHVIEILLEEGALDVWLTPIIMKKGRPAITLSILAPNSLRDKLEEIIFSETSSIGLRYYPVERTIADRSIETVDLPWGRVRVKISRHKGKVCNISVEYDDCRHRAMESGIPLKEVQAAALAKARESFLG